MTIYRQKKSLQFKGNVEHIVNNLSKKISKRIEAEKLVKWTLHGRKSLVSNVFKTFQHLKDQFTVRFEKLKSCSSECSLEDKFQALFGRSEHRSNQEPYYAETSNKVYTATEPIAIDDICRKAVIHNVTEHRKSLGWSCDDGCTS